MGESYNEALDGITFLDPIIVGGTIDDTPIGQTTPAAGAFTQLSGSINTETLAATKTLVVTDLVVQWLDPDGSDRDVVLPAEASSTNLLFIILNDADGAGEDLVVKNDAPSTIATLCPGMSGIFSCDGTDWKWESESGWYYDSVNGSEKIINDAWIRAANYADTDVINMLKVNVDDEIEVGATLIVGTSEAVEDAGAITLFDMPVSSTPNAGDEMSATIKIDGDNILTIGAEADGAGGIQNKFLSTLATKTKCIKIDTNLYGNPSTNPPAPETLGSVQVATFTVDTDKGRYKCPIPDDYAGGAMTLRLYWTKSTAADESTKTVKWQVKEKPLYVGNNIAAGETTVSIQDVYDSAAVGEYLLYETDPMTIPATAVGRAHSFEVEAIAPTGTALSEPALVYGCLEYTAYVL